MCTLQGGELIAKENVSLRHISIEECEVRVVAGSCRSRTNVLMCAPWMWCGDSSTIHGDSSDGGLRGRRPNGPYISRTTGNVKNIWLETPKGACNIAHF